MSVDKRRRPQSAPKLYIHIVFSVKGRQPLIPKRHKAELHRYITGIITKKKQKLLQINSMPDHIHPTLRSYPSGI